MPLPAAGNRQEEYPQNPLVPANRPVPVAVSPTTPEVSESGDSDHIFDDAEIGQDELVSLSDIGSKSANSSSIQRRTDRPRTKHQQKLTVLIGVSLATAIVALFAVVAISVRPSKRTAVTPQQGSLIVDSPNPNVRVAVSQGGKRVASIDAKNNWQLMLTEGRYEVALFGDNGNVN